jgi:outer membrane protein
LSAAGQVTLDQCLSWGLDRNSSMQRATLEKQLDIPGSRAAWGQFLPSVYVGYGIDQSRYYNPTYVDADGKVVTLPRTETITIAGQDTTIVYEVPEGRRRNSSYFIQIEEVLFDGGKSYLNLRNSKLLNQRRDQNLRQSQMQLRSEITRAFAGAVAAARRLDLAARVAGQRRLQLDLAQTRFETGSVTRRDVLQAEVDLGRARADSLNAALDRKRTIEALNILVGLPLDTVYSCANFPPPVKPDWDADSLSSVAVENRGDLKSARLSVGMAQNDHLAAKGEYLPLLTATYINSRSEQSGSNVDFTLTPRNRYSQGGLSLQWLLFDRFTRSLRTQEAKVRRQQAALSASELEREVERQVRVAADRLLSLYEQVQVAVENCRWADETLKFEQERYRFGSATA